MQKRKPWLQLVALIGGAITFGTAYYLLVLAHPSWSAAPFDSFLVIFQDAILKIGMSQVVISTTALIACITLFLMDRDWSWLIAVALLLVSLPVTMFLLMPINLHFLDLEPGVAGTAEATMLADWGRYQIVRVIADGLAFVAMCKPLIWPKHAPKTPSSIKAMTS